MEDVYKDMFEAKTYEDLLAAYKVVINESTDPFHAMLFAGTFVQCFSILTNVERTAFAMDYAKGEAMATPESSDERLF